MQRLRVITYRMLQRSKNCFSLLKFYCIIAIITRMYHYILYSIHVKVILPKIQVQLSQMHFTADIRQQSRHSKVRIKLKKNFLAVNMHS